MPSAAEQSNEPDAAAKIATELWEILGVEVTPRTTMYIQRRLRELRQDGAQNTSLKRLLLKNRLVEFKEIFQEILTAQPFVSARDLSIDVINALNFVIFYELEGKRVAREGLRLVLRWRKNRLHG